MKSYLVYLDESGQFEKKKNRKQKMPSIVGGYFIPAELGNSFGGNIINRVQRGNIEKFGRLNFEKFHAVEEIDTNTNEFIVCVMEEMAKSGARLIKASSHPYEKDGEMAKTVYLRTMAEAVFHLVEALLEETDEPIKITVVYDHRGRSDDDHRDIEEKDYTDNIRDILDSQLAKLAESTRRRLQTPISLHKGFAKENKNLMVSDMINWAYRGNYRHGISSLNDNLLRRIKKLECLSYDIRPQNGEEYIKKCLADNHIGDALYACYYEFYNDLASVRKKLGLKIAEKFLNMSRKMQELQLEIFIQYILGLIEIRRFDDVEKLVKEVEDGFIEQLGDRKKGYSDFRHNMHFCLLTAYTHKGQVIKAENELTVCKELMKEMHPSWERLGYIVDFKIREQEHLKNIYDFSGANELLESLREKLEPIVELGEELLDIAETEKAIRSITLGKIYGALATGYAYQSLNCDNRKEILDEARKVAESALKQFVSANDKSRTLQNLSLIEYHAGNYEKALRCLYAAVHSDEPVPERSEDIDIGQLGKYIAELPSPTSDFCLMHYVNILRRAADGGDNELADKLYNAIDSDNVKIYEWLEEREKETSETYPYTTIRWNLGAYLSGREKQSSKANEQYKIAYRNLREDSEAITIITQAMILSADAYGRTGNQEYKRQLDSCYKSLKKRQLP